MPRKLHLDTETFSSADIRKCGLDNYVNAPDFTVTVLAWAYDDGPVTSIIWPGTQIVPTHIRVHIKDGGEIRAHNAAFEFAVLTQHFKLDVKPEQMVCTLQKALAYGLPAGLLAAGKALKLETIKDETKRLLMLSMGRPRGKDAQPWHESDPGRLAELAAYCEDDVRAERALDAAIPDLAPFERRLALLDGEINRKGVLLDIDAVRALRRAALAELNRINLECARLTNGAVTAPGSQVARLMAWLAKEGTTLPDVAKSTIEATLDAKHPATVRRVLELRQAAARSSVAKLERMQDVASTHDRRARHLLQFYGAGRTGRWAGRLVQPQNLPRVPEGHDAETVIGMAAIGFDVSMDAISKTLRSCFVAREGHVLVAADLAQIEARVLAWLAGQQDMLKAFRAGEDVYTLTARKVGSEDRQLGKVLVLACGYGMGPAKFAATAEGYGVVLTELQARPYVYGWRNSNMNTTMFWGEVERAVWAAVTHPGYVFHLPHGMAVRKQKGGVLQIRKPNGVKLTYHNMRIEDGGLVFDGVNSISKKWQTERTYGGRLVENVVQSVARDVMAEGMLAAEAVPVMSVHDEVVWEAEEGFIPKMPVPSWASGLPVEAKVHIGVRYAK